MPPQQHPNGNAPENKRKAGKEPVDWVKYFGGRPPTEIIEIHDDDSPAPPTEVHRIAPQTNGDVQQSRHVDKRRRVNGALDAPAYSVTNTPYSASNGASTESLQATTAPTSLGSQVSTNSKLDGTQAGQKRKRTTRTQEAERKKLEVERRGPQGYLAEYGEYIPPPKQHRKQRDVHVPKIPEVCVNLYLSIDEKPANRLIPQRSGGHHEKVDDDDGHYLVQDGSKLGDRYTLVSLLGQGTFGKVVRAVDIRSRKEVAVKIIRAVPKVRSFSPIHVCALTLTYAAVS